MEREQVNPRPKLATPNFLMESKETHDYVGIVQ